MKIIRILTLAFLLLNIIACDQPQAAKKTFTIEGNTQGTTYKVSYIAEKEMVNKASVDSLLVAFSNSLSTYIDSSIISLTNKTAVADSFLAIDKFFFEVFKISEAVHNKSEKLFDPSVMPLVHFWGFGVRKNLDRDTTQLDSLRSLIGFQNFSIKNEDGKYWLSKKKKNSQLDFNAVAQGYSVDVLAEFLEANGIKNYMAEIGGEVRCKGKNARDVYWNIGIDLPVASGAEDRKLKATVSLNNQALATSGNYRKYLDQQGQKYGHTINPLTGYPEVNTTLSASVITKSGGYADAYATAFMVMGWEKALQIAEADTTIEAYFIYSDAKGNMLTKMTSGLKNQLKEIE
jgi:thiamine biosynthesis lipoprotein